MIIEARLVPAPGWTRIIIEKPFGRNLAAERALNDYIPEILE